MNNPTLAKNYSICLWGLRRSHMSNTDHRISQLVPKSKSLRFSTLSSPPRISKAPLHLHSPHYRLRGTQLLSKCTQWLYTNTKRRVPVPLQIRTKSFNEWRPRSQQIEVIDSWPSGAPKWQSRSWVNKVSADPCLPWRACGVREKLNNHKNSTWGFHTRAPSSISWLINYLSTNNCLSTLLQVLHKQHYWHSKCTPHMGVQWFQSNPDLDGWSSTRPLCPLGSQPQVWWCPGPPPLQTSGLQVQASPKLRVQKVLYFGLLFHYSERIHIKGKSRQRKICMAGSLACSRCRALGVLSGVRRDNLASSWWGRVAHPRFTVF